MFVFPVRTTHAVCFSTARTRLRDRFTSSKSAFRRPRDAGTIVDTTASFRCGRSCAPGYPLNAQKAWRAPRRFLCGIHFRWDDAIDAPPFVCPTPLIRATCSGLHRSGTWSMRGIVEGDEPRLPDPAHIIRRKDRWDRTPVRHLRASRLREHESLGSPQANPRCAAEAHQRDAEPRQGAAETGEESDALSWGRVELAVEQEAATLIARIWLRSSTRTTQ